MTPQPTLLKAPQEKKAPEYLEAHFDLIQTNLPIADYWNQRKVSIDLIMVESKIGTDGMDIPRLMDELTRMNYAEYRDAVRHAVWYWTKTMQRAYMRHVGFKHIVTAVVEDQYEKACDRFRSLCHHANVYPHIVRSKSKYVMKMKDIFAGKYDHPLQIHKHPSKKLSELAQVMSWCKGITERTAIVCAHLTTKQAIYDAIGVKKNGEPLKKGVDLLKYLARLYNQIRPLLES